MDDIQNILKKYFQAWNNGLISKDGDEIRRFMSKNFVGYWAHSNMEKPDEYGYDYDLDGVLQQYGQAEKSFVPVSIVERKNRKECLVLGRETNVIEGKPYTAQCMFVWRDEEEGWKLLREYIELER
ncbi:nuclear transport factor 2 family protein [Bacillus sp. FJAT-22090]|uniref:nuclear transport factor 2 family protein n=1 Tax=Bacillus sp. FJAT-22090 TaxID=1581038 RepID=UPI0011A6A00D|nr:nuclear transport factor 2 family protein [Bacillus sp. FJAT-22090]